MTRRIFLLTAILAVLVCARAQQPVVPPPSPQPASVPVELVPLIVADGAHHGDVDLSVDIDAIGNITQTSAISGNAKLARIAGKLLNTFRYTDHPGVTGAHVHVTFLMGKDFHSIAVVYPPIARMSHVYGPVELAAAITPDGQVSKVTALSGPPMLRGAAVDSLKKWTFPPTQSGGEAVAARAIVIINFPFGAAQM